MIEPLIQIGRLGPKGFAVVWKDSSGVTHSASAPNRTELMRIVGIHAAPMIRGDLPVIDEVIDIHAPKRRAGDE